MSKKRIIEDKRKEVAVLSPYLPFVPEGVTNTVKNIVLDGEIIGDIEIGTDGFVQGVMSIGGKYVRFETYKSWDDMQIRLYDKGEDE